MVTTSLQSCHAQEYPIGRRREWLPLQPKFTSIQFFSWALPVGSASLFFFEQNIVFQRTWLSTNNSRPCDNNRTSPSKIDIPGSLRCHPNFQSSVASHNLFFSWRSKTPKLEIHSTIIFFIELNIYIYINLGTSSPPACQLKKVYDNFG